MQTAHAPLEVRFDSCGLCLLESSHAADFRMEWTTHPFDKVIAPLGGSGSLSERTGRGRASFPLRVGSVALVEAGAAHRIDDASTQPLRLYVLCIGPGFPFGPSARPPGRVRVVSDVAAAGRALATLREIAAARQRVGTGNVPVRTERTRDLLLCGLAATLVARLLERPTETADTSDMNGARNRVAGFIQRISEEFHGPGSIDEAARATGLGRRRFTQLFSVLAGETYGARLRRVRVEHAQRLLQHEGRSPLAAAFECGYEDASTFYRAFKRHTGLPPLSWLEAQQKASRPV